MSISPNRAAFAQLAARADDGPVVMLNLLAFKPGDGRTEYGQSAGAATSMIEARGGKVLWSGRPDQVLIGDAEGDRWDMVALVEYPSRRQFIEMVSSPDYQAAHTHREGGLERTVLIACDPLER
jgi:uncharacterized protein (DUF1330 family)